MFIVLSGSKPSPPGHSIQLVTWYEDLPPELKLNLKLAKEVAALPHLLMTHLSFRWLLILLHRPFYRRQRGVEVDLSYKVSVNYATA